MWKTKTLILKAKSAVYNNNLVSNKKKKTSAFI